MKYNMPWLLLTFLVFLALKTVHSLGGIYLYEQPNAVALNEKEAAIGLEVR